MRGIFTNKFLIKALTSFFIIIMFFGALSYDYKFNFPFIDRSGDEYLDNSLTKAVATYAIIHSNSWFYENKFYSNQRSLHV